MSNAALNSPEAFAEDSFALEERTDEAYADAALPVEAPNDPLSQAYADQQAAPAWGSEGDDLREKARPIPRISIQAFCTQPQTAQVLQAVSQDRRLAKTHFAVQMGGIEAAVANYMEAPTPNLIVLESAKRGEEMVEDLDRLAEFCDADTRVVVIGHVNDVWLYRALVDRGVSDYMIAPVSPLQLMETISRLYHAPESEPVGNSFVFVGARGGAGSSTVCHNTGWALSELLSMDVVIADLDLAFGTAGLDFNQDPVQGIADALVEPDRLDEVLLDRLLTKCTEHLSLFAAPSVLDREFQETSEAYEWVLDVVRQSVPYVVIDLPHVWTPWARQQMMLADEIVVTSTPDLASLRNTKNIVDLLNANRNNDRPPHLVLNMTKMPKRPEISAQDFSDALSLPVAMTVDFDPVTFGTASNNGQMIGEFQPKHKASDQFRELALALSNKSSPSKKSGGSLLAPLLSRFSSKK
ncbi:MAG: cellulose synthase operon protein YhjQ/BcsQ [Pseudomonadota bacterium]